jgi:hypothetical protein
LVRKSVSSLSSNHTFPSVGSSSMLMVRKSVDFPDPEGPMTTTTSLGSTSRSTPRRTCRVPNHL